MELNATIHRFEDDLRRHAGPPTLAQLTNRSILLGQTQADCFPLHNGDWEFFDLVGRAGRVHTHLGGGPVGEVALLSPYMDPQLIFESHRNYIDAQFPRSASAFPRHGAHGRVRVGFVGADFRLQATAILMVGLIEELDHAAFELFAYDYGTEDATPYRARYLAAFDHFAAIGELDDEAAAQRIHADRIDVLINLRGISENSRIGIFALRPSPIQVQYLYYPASSGAWFMDYIIADAYVVPPGHERFYAETVIRLPGSYQPNDSRRPRPQPGRRADNGLPEEAVVMANFGKPEKITPDVFELWMRLLRQDPGRVLWLLRFPHAPRFEANIRREAAIWDVAQDRLCFSDFAGNYETHLKRFGCVDLMLDTFPYGGHTVTSDALWAGVPVLTVVGETFASRVAGSLLQAVGLDGFVTTSFDDYVARGDALLADPAALAAARAHLEEGRAGFDLFNTALYARRFGDALRGMVAAAAVQADSVRS